MPTLDEITAAQAEGKRFTVTGGPAIAYYFHSVQTEQHVEEEVDGDEVYYYESERNTGMVFMVMVGDDYKHLIDPEDLTIIDEDAYCAQCGQIGCTHDGRERD